MHVGSCSIDQHDANRRTPVSLVPKAVCRLCTLPRHGWTAAHGALAGSSRAVRLSQCTVHTVAGMTLVGRPSTKHAVVGSVLQRLLAVLRTGVMCESGRAAYRWVACGLMFGLADMTFLGRRSAKLVLWLQYTAMLVRVRPASHPQHTMVT